MFLGIFLRCCWIDLGARWIMHPLRAYTRVVHCLPISELHVSVNVLESYLLQELCKCTLWWNFHALER